MKRLMSMLLVVFAPNLWAMPDPTALLQSISDRPEGEMVASELHFELRSAKGSVIQRVASAYQENKDKRTRFALYFSSPRSLRGTALLSWREKKGEVTLTDQWLYLPALKRSRRIPGRDRGKYFLGTDLTYDDMNHFAKVNLSDYEVGQITAVPERQGYWRIHGVTRNAGIAKDLGYKSAEWIVDEPRRMVVEAKIHDLQDQPLKRVRYLDLTRIDGAWTAQTIKVENLKTGHTTLLRFVDIQSPASFDVMLLTEQGLEQGP
ncbi:MAG: outer membrane lipoprotein-sorting protein [Panacagrimonas sp.]